MSIRLKVNDIIDTGGSKLVIMTLNTSQDQAICFEPATNTKKSMSIRELRQKLADGSARSSAAPPTRGLLQEFNKDSPAYARFLFNQAAVKRLKDLIHHGKSTREAIKLAAETPIVLATGETAPMCSERQAYRLLKLSDENPIALMPTYTARGNRVPRYGTRMEEIALQEIEDHYAVKKSRITLSFLKEIITKKADAEGILPDGATVSRKYVRSILLNSWNSDVDHKRLDPRVAKSAKAVAKDRIRPGAPLNRVEIDTLHLPFLARDEHGIVDEILVMMAIDCETSYPLSWWMMRAKPTTDDTFSCLERAIYPKTELLKKLGIAFTVDPFGSIMNLILDNGQENSRHRLAALTAVGINPDWAPVNSGHRKPFIERLNRSLKEALQSLPGCTRFNGDDGKRTAEAREDNLLTMGELEHWIVRWLFEVWANHPLDRFVTAHYDTDSELGITPALRWQTYEGMQVLPIPPQREDWRRVKFLTSRGKLSAKTGISSGTFTFRGINLVQLIHQYGPDCYVNYHYDPHDFRTVYVDDKETGAWIELINSEVGPNTPAYSFISAQARRKAIKNAHPASAITKNFSNDLIEKSTEKTSKRQLAENRRKETKERERSKQARSRADANPIINHSAESAAKDMYIATDTIEKLVKHKKTKRT